MIQTFFQILFGILATYIVYIIVKPLTQLILLKIKHGKDIHIVFMPILGQIFYFGRALSKHKDVDYYRRKAIREKPNVKVVASNFILDKIHINLIDPLLIKEFFQTPEKYRKLDIFLFNDLIFGEGLLFSEDQKWKNQRKIIGHQFTFENLKCRIPVIKELTQKVLEKHIKTDQEIKILEVFSKITGEVLTQTFFGQEFSQYKVDGLTLTEAIVEIITIQIDLSFNKLWSHVRGILYGYKSNVPRSLMTVDEKELLTKISKFQTIVKAAIGKREEEFEENEKKQNQDFIQIYLSETSFQFQCIIGKNNLKTSQDELLHQFTTFAFAGTDTTSTMTTMACYILGQKPLLQEQIRAHLKEHVKSFSELNHQDLTKLVQISALCSEVLRMYPPANGIFPRTARQQHQIGNFTINPSYIVDCGILPIQQSSSYYTNPEEFNINRWLDNDLKEPHAFVAFSSGPRNCIGQHMAMTEAKIILSYILLTYKIIPDPKRNLQMKITSLYAPADDRLVLFQPL